MATKSALEQMAELQAQMDALRQNAISELAQQIASKKQELKALQDEYERVSGKPVRAEFGGEQEEGGKRTRLSKEDKESLKASVVAALQSAAKEGLAMGELEEKTGFKALQIRNVLKEVPHKKEGDKRNTRYIFKAK